MVVIRVFCFDDKKAKFRCINFWGIRPIEYAIIAYTDDDTVIIEGNLYRTDCEGFTADTFSRYGRGFRCDESDFEAGFGHREYDDGEFRRLPAPRHFVLGAAKPTEDMHCNQCGVNKQHTSVYDDYHYNYKCNECGYLHT